MKNFNHLFKTLLFVFALFCTSLSYSQPCTPSPTTPGASNLIYTLSNSNALAVGTVDFDDDGYLTYPYTIPYHIDVNGLIGELTFKNNITTCLACGGATGPSSRKIEIYKDGFLIATQTNTNTITITPGAITNNTRFIVKAFCHLNNYKTLKIKIQVTKEPVPTYSLAFAAYCKKNNFSDLYNGYIGFSVTGTNSNPEKFKLKVTSPSGACLPQSYKLTDLGIVDDMVTTQNFYNCNTNGTYTINLIYQVNSIHDDPVTKDLGTVFTWRKRFYSCDNLQGGNTSLPQLKTSIIAPNPASDYIVLNYSVVTESAKVTIFDLNNNLVNTIELDKKNQEHKIEINKLERGIYILKIEDGETHIIERFIKS